VAVDGRAVTFHTTRRGLGRALINASVPITVLTYNGPLLCSFNMPMKGKYDWQVGKLQSNGYRQTEETQFRPVAESQEHTESCGQCCC